MGDRATQSKTDRRPERHQAKKAAIVEAAWQLAREEGLNGLSLRVLADRVGLRQPSLYSYFSSKNDLFDAMFADGNRRFMEVIEGLDLPKDGREQLKMMARANVAFCVEDPVRAELMFLRTIPGFEPSAEAYAIAIRFDDWATQVMLRAGIRTIEQRDMFVALLNGLVTVQQANDPGGRRWVRHVDWAVDMLLREVDRQRRKGGATGRPLGPGAAGASSHRADRH
jgi:AcrR family transcriptional regulator